MEPYADGSVERAKRGRSDHTKYAGWSKQAINQTRERRTEIPSVMRNKRDIWSVSTNSYRMDGHFAMYPERLIEPCILAGSPVGGIVLDPFFGSGTTGAAAKRLGREYIGIDLNPEYCKLAQKRIDAIRNERKMI